MTGSRSFEGVLPALITPFTDDELSVHAERAGAQGVMVVPPFYGAPTWPELLAHISAVADRVSIPIMYYNIPSITGVTLTVERAADLARVGVASLKDTGGDAVLQTELMQREGEVPVLLNGWDTLTFAALAAGSRGVVWGAASFMPAECVALHRLLIEDVDLVAARELWSRLWPICAFLESTSYAAAVKSACRTVGLTTGPVRGPLQDLTAPDAARLAALLEAAGIAMAVPTRA